MFDRSLKNLLLIIHHLNHCFTMTPSWHILRRVFVFLLFGCGSIPSTVSVEWLAGLSSCCCCCTVRYSWNSFWNHLQLDLLKCWISNVFRFKPWVQKRWNLQQLACFTAIVLWVDVIFYNLLKSPCQFCVINVLVNCYSVVQSS